MDITTIITKVIDSIATIIANVMYDITTVITNATTTLLPPSLLIPSSPFSVQHQAIIARTIATVLTNAITAIATIIACHWHSLLITPLPPPLLALPH